MTRIASALTTVALLGFSVSAQSAPVTFFGEDLNGGSIAHSHPNADAARASFFSNLTGGVETQTFETIPANTSTPLTVSFGATGTATLTGTGFVERGTSSSSAFTTQQTLILQSHLSALAMMSSDLTISPSAA